MDWRLLLSRLKEFREVFWEFRFLEKNYWEEEEKNKSRWREVQRLAQQWQAPTFLQWGVTGHSLLYSLAILELPRLDDSLGVIHEVASSHRKHFLPVWRLRGQGMRSDLPRVLVTENEFRLLVSRVCSWCEWQEDPAGGSSVSMVSLSPSILEYLLFRPLFFHVYSSYFKTLVDVHMVSDWKYPLGNSPVFPVQINNRQTLSFIFPLRFGTGM